MPYEIDPDEMEAAISLAMISPIPIAPKKKVADSIQKMPSRWISPSDQQNQFFMNIGSDQLLISEQQREDMSRLVYIILRSNLPESLQDTTTSPQLILIARAIEKKLFRRAESARSYLDLSTLKFRLSALACAVLIYSDEHGQELKKGGGSSGRSETCDRLMRAARESLSHSIMVLISFESRKLGLDRDSGRW